MCVPSFPSLSRRSLKPLRGSGSACRFQIFLRRNGQNANAREQTRQTAANIPAKVPERDPDLIFLDVMEKKKKKTTFDRLGIPEASRLKTAVWFLHQHTSSGPFGHVWVIIPQRPDHLVQFGGERICSSNYPTLGIFRSRNPLAWRNHQRSLTRSN